MRGEPVSSISGNSPLHQEPVNTEIATTGEKNNCARVACAAETAGSWNVRTVAPPRMPCAITPPRAAKPIQRIQARFSTLHSHAAKIIVRMPTQVAITRWVNSYRMPPTMGGASEPYASGQSGIERPASFEVTKAPAIRSRKVQHAVKTANL